MKRSTEGSSSLKPKSPSAPMLMIAVPVFLTALSAAIAAPPVIRPSSALQHKVAELGKSVSLAVTASSDTPPVFRWQLDGRVLANETNRSLILNRVQASDEGDYIVAVSNVDGTVISEPVRLWVVPPVTNFLKRNFTNNAGLRLPYFICAPANYDPGRSYPLVAFFTGGHAGENLFTGFLTDNPCTRVFASYRQQQEDPAIFVWPCRRAGDESWNDQYRRQASDLLDRLLSEFNIDTNRVYLGGISGGTGFAWDIMGNRPGFFAAVSLMSGGQGATRSANLKDLPFWASCAKDDEAGNLGPTQVAVQTLRSAGARVIYTEYNSGGHIGGCTMLSSTPAWVQWLLSQRRGRASTAEPLLSIHRAGEEAIQVTGAASVSLEGSAEALGQRVTRVTWQNVANGTKGEAAGTNTWTVSQIPLMANKTNVIMVTATTTSWAPMYGGNTTFNDTLSVLCSPIRASLALNGTGAVLNWNGGAPPYHVQRSSDLVAGDWTNLLTNVVPPQPLTLDPRTAFYRVVGQ